MRAHPLRHATLTPFPEYHSQRRATGATAQNLRAANLSLVLRHVVAQPGNVTRASIAGATGATRATISRLVDELVSHGFITESRAPSLAQRGRPPIGLAPAAGAVLALGLEVTVDSLKAHLIDLTGQTLAAAQQPRPSTPSPRASLEPLHDLGARLLADHAPASAWYVGAALSVPGIVTRDRLVVAHNLGWVDLPLSDISSHLGELAPRFIANEADLASYRVGHPRPGVPSEVASFIYVSGEVGVGAGIVLGQRQLTGGSGGAGEIGHISVDPTGTLCSCGSRGCVETFLGHKALLKRAGLPPSASAADVRTRALAGDSHVLQALDDGARALGVALAAAMNVLDIHHIFLGGNLADLSDFLIPTVSAELLSLSAQARLNPPVISTVDNSTHFSVEGGAHRVLDDVVAAPASYLDALTV